MDTLRSALNRLEERGAALGHFNVSDLVLLHAVVAAAGEIKVPVLVGLPGVSEPSSALVSSQCS